MNPTFCTLSYFLPDCFYAIKMFWALLFRKMLKVRFEKISVQLRDIKILPLRDISLIAKCFVMISVKNFLSHHNHEGKKIKKKETCKEENYIYVL